MESETKSQPPSSTAKKPSTSTPSPIKPPPKSIALSPPNPELVDQIGTPEKPVHMLRRARNRSVAFSVKAVRQVALGLHKSDQGAAASVDRADAHRSDDDLLALEEPLAAGSGSARKTQKARALVKLPDKYEILGEFFNSMVSSIQLLRLKGSMSTFSNICTSIQHLTDRRFTCGHLAQLKSILPEAISIKKVLVHDETTCCMKPELQVILLADAVGDSIKQRGESGHSGLRKVFRERLENFFQEHPEGDDIPEEELPHPFNQNKPSILPKVPSVSSNSKVVESSSFTVSQQPFAVPSHVPGSFQRRFSQKVSISDMKRTPLACLDKAPHKDDPIVHTILSRIKPTTKQPISNKTLSRSPPQLPLLITNKVDVKDLTRAENYCPRELNTLEGTPAKLVSTPARLMTTTPDIQTPKTYRPTMAYDTPPVKKSEKRTARTKLFPTPTKKIKTNDVENEATSSLAEDDVISFLPKALLQSVKEKERKAWEEKEAGVGKASRRQKMLACLPDIFDLIHLIFQSGSRSVMTKQELIHKIIAGHCKIVDRGEVEEQLELLPEILPNWISVKKASSGDILYCVSKICSVEDARQRLAEAE